MSSAVVPSSRPASGPPSRAPFPVRRTARCVLLAGLAIANPSIVGLGSRRAFADEAAAPPLRPAPADAPSLGAALATIERHAVRVHFTFQRDVSAEAEGREPVDASSWTEQLRRWRMTWRITGYVVKDRRTVVSSDHFSAPATIKSIEIRTAKGAKVPVSSWEFLPHVKLCVFRTAVDLDTEPVAFAASGEVARLPLVVGNVTEGTSGLETWADTLTVSRRRSGDASRPAGFDFAARADAGLSGAGLTNRVDLVLKSDGTALGFRIGSPFDLDPAHWRGDAIVADLDHSVPLRGLAERARALNEESFVHEVRLTFRREGGSEMEFGVPGFSFGSNAGSSPDDARYYGYAIAPNLLLVPKPLSDALVRRIEKVTIEDEGDPVIEASYEGRVAGTGAFVVRLVGGILDTPTAEGALPPPAAGHAFLVHRVSRRAGSRRDSVTYDRSVGMPNGYGDRPFFASEQPVAAGSFLMDLDGRVFGVATELRPEDAERTAGDRAHGGREGYGTIAALFGEGGGPSEWVKSLDKRAIPQKSEQAKRLPWLGVEYVTINGADVAEALDVSGPTRDGARGLLVNVVHADSPAARAALKVDDLLLSAKRTSGPGCDAPPIDLKDSADDGAYRFSGGDGGVPAPWALRRNALVTLLESFEVGTTYDLEIWRDGASRTISLTVEQAPRDVDSALKSKDDATGLTVKELTYEVRHALHLTSADKGVLVAAVEDGMAAFQARINVNELIREMDGGPVADQAAFAKGLADARAAGKASVRIVVERLGRSRFVDLRLSGTDAPPSPSAVAPAGRVPAK